MVGKIISIKSGGVDAHIGGVMADGYTIKNIELRRDGHIKVNRYCPNEAHYLVTAISDINGKDALYMALSVNYDAITFEEVIVPDTSRNTVHMEKKD